jgi:hypothetical protein
MYSLTSRVFFLVSGEGAKAIQNFDKSSLSSMFNIKDKEEMKTIHSFHRYESKINVRNPTLKIDKRLCSLDYINIMFLIID